MERLLVFIEKASNVWQAQLCAISDVSPAPRWSTLPVERQRLLGRRRSLWCWWRSHPWVRWAPPSVWRSPSQGKGRPVSPGSPVRATESVWWDTGPGWAPRVQGLWRPGLTRGLRGVAWAGSSHSLQTHCCYHGSLLASPPLPSV